MSFVRKLPFRSKASLPARPLTATRDFSNRHHPLRVQGCQRHHDRCQHISHRSPILTRNMSTVQILTDPTPEQAVELFEELEAKFPKSLGDDRWYLVALAALTGSTQPLFASNLYTHLISQPRYETSAARQALMKRMREVLVKCVSIVGVCKPLEAVFAITEVEKAEDRDFSFSRENWQSGPENVKRGEDWLGQIYQHNIGATDTRLAAHKDFSYITRELTYGFYLSDHSILGAVETELVVLSGIMIQNLPLETGWHLRGCRRIGMSSEEVEGVQQCIEMVAKFSALSLYRVPRVKDVEHEV